MRAIPQVCRAAAGWAKDGAVRVELLRQGCFAGRDHASCAEAYAMTPQRDVLECGCDVGSVDACAKLLEQQIDERDLGAARATSEKLCERHQQCEPLEVILARSCTADVGADCRRLASALRRKDPIRALGTLEGSCRAGDRESCATLAEWKRPRAP